MAAVYAQLDIVQPWTVGRYATLDQADAWKRTHLIPDLVLTKKNHQLYVPVIFPGFSWHNLNRDKPENQIPRPGGKFLWRQAYNARTAGATIVKIAMFDDVNEGTAILKAAPSRSDAPTQGCGRRRVVKRLVPSFSWRSGTHISWRCTSIS
jgi:hypothetical protein